MKVESFNKLALAQKKYEEAHRPAIFDPKTKEGKAYIENVQTADKEYAQAYTNMFGENVPKEKLEKYLTAQSVAHGIGETAAVIGTGVAAAMTGGGSLLVQSAVAGTTATAYKMTEDATSEEGLTKEKADNAVLSGIHTTEAVAALGGVI